MGKEGKGREHTELSGVRLSLKTILKHVSRIKLGAKVVMRTMRQIARANNRDKDCFLSNTPNGCEGV